MTQTDLYNLIQAQTGKTIGRDRINRIVNGKQTNFQVDTAKIISNALGLTIDEILD
jgi:plasmid maintenance system antidote protein VapI